jgi:hypothetical protein
MKCDCGKDLASNAHICPGCGKRFTHPFVKFLAWCFVAVSVLGIIGAIIGGNSSSNRAPSVTSDTTAHLIPAKYDEANAVIGLCGKPTQDHPQELHAGAGSEGRALVYRKYNTELWFYRGPESSQWVLMNAFKANGDDTITVQEANERMPCLKGGLQEHIREPKNAEEKAAVESARVAAQNAEAAQTASDDKKYSDLSTQAAIGAASLKAAVRNPDSLKLEKVLGMDDGTICYEYRAQNGFGGLNREFAVLLPGANSLTTSTAAWNKHCAHKKGHDVRANVETLMKFVPTN